MRVYDNGSLFSVGVTGKEVSDFNDKWPSSSIPEKPIWFQYEKRNGDLVDMKPLDIGSEVLALSENARDYGMKKLKLVL